MPAAALVNRPASMIRGRRVFAPPRTAPCSTRPRSATASRSGRRRCS
jgi:hypothetical protein